MLLAVAGFYLNGASYPNNSVISLTDIGEGSGALYCLTNSTSCCQSADTGSSDLGQWILSNGYVPNSSGFFIERGPSVVLLNHKANEMGPTGIYTCRVPDASGVNRTMYIGVDSGTYVAILNKQPLFSHPGCKLANWNSYNLKMGYINFI